jgi:hypothetical protein
MSLLYNHCVSTSTGFNSRIDEDAYCGRIIAYKIQWSNLAWTDWIVPGMNDLDCKYNTAAMPCSVPYLANSLRKMWAYFYDHTHTIIICRWVVLTCTWRQNDRMNQSGCVVRSMMTVDRWQWQCAKCCVCVKIWWDLKIKCPPLVWRRSSSHACIFIILTAL